MFSWPPLVSHGLYKPSLSSSTLPWPPLASLQPSPMYHNVVTSCTIIVSSLNSVNLLAFASLVWQLGIHCVLVAPWMSLPQDSVILSSSLPLLFIKCLASCVLLFWPLCPFLTSSGFPWPLQALSSLLCEILEPHVDTYPLCLSHSFRTTPMSFFSTSYHCCDNHLVMAGSLTPWPSTAQTSKWLFDRTNRSPLQDCLQMGGKIYHPPRT